MEEAVDFYLSYLNTKNASTFLPGVLSTILIGIMDDLSQRMDRQLYKLSVEQNLCNHILTADTDIDQRTHQLVRGRSVREVDSKGDLSGEGPPPSGQQQPPPIYSPFDRQKKEAQSSTREGLRTTAESRVGSWWPHQKDSL